MTRVYNGGTYDLLHAGHLYAFQQMRDLAGPTGEVIVGLNRDEFVARFKGHAPLQSLVERMEVVAALRLVDRVVVNAGDEDSRPVLDVVMPDVIAVGHDWWSVDDSRYCEQMGFTPEWLAERAMRLHYLRWLPGRSSTGLRRLAAVPDPDVILTHSGPLTARLRP